MPSLRVTTFLTFASRWKLRGHVGCINFAPAIDDDDDGANGCDGNTYVAVVHEPEQYELMINQAVRQTTNVTSILNRRWCETV